MSGVGTKQRREQRSRRRLWAFLLIGLVIVAAGWLTAILVLDVTDKRIEAAISLSLKVFSTIVGAGVAIAGLIVKPRDGRNNNDGPLIRRATTSESVRILSGAVEYTEAESLVMFIRATRSIIKDDLRKGPFVQLTTVAEVQGNLDAYIPNLDRLDHPQGNNPTAPQQERIGLDELGARYRCIALLGDPGAGKSTILKELTERRLRHVDKAGMNNAQHLQVQLPLFTSLSSWTDPNQPMRDFLLEQMEGAFGPGSFYVRDLDNQLSAGRFLILLDGLNEIPNRTTEAGAPENDKGRGLNLGARRPTRLDPREQSLLKFAELYRECHFIITCRSHDYFRLPQWRVVRVLDMDAQQADEFMEAYADRTVRQSLQEEIRSSQALAAIARNPFFLSKIIESYLPGQNLTSRGRILNMLIRHLLTREAQRADDTAQTHNAQPYSEFVEHAGIVAYRMLRQGRVGDSAAIPDDVREQDWQEFLLRTGLIVDRDGKRYFFHQIMQEHFAAMALSTHAIRRSPKFLLRDIRWLEVVRLWRDVDDNLDKKLVHCLSARRLPWRIPLDGRGPIYDTIRSALNVAIAVIACTYLLDWMEGPVNSLTWPFDPFPISPILIVFFLLGVTLACAPFQPHQLIISNSAYVLGGTRYAAAIRRMIKAYRRVQGFRRRRISTAIAQFDSRALPHIARGLLSRRWRVRIGSADALSVMAGRNPQLTADMLVTAAKIEDHWVARGLLAGLIRYQDEASLEATRTALNRIAATPHISMREQSTVASLSPAEPGERSGGVRRTLHDLFDAQRLADNMYAVATNDREGGAARRRAIAGLAQLNSAHSADALLRIAANHPELSDTAITQIEMLKNPEILDVLSRYADSANQQIRLTVARVAGRVGREAASAVLEQLAADPDEDVRKESTESLAFTGREHAVPQLARLIQDPNDIVRSTAMRTLTRSYMDDAAAILIETALDTRTPDRSEVIKFLSFFDDSDVVEALQTLTGDLESDVSRAAERALKKIHKRRRDIGVDRRSSNPLRHPFAHARRSIAEWLNWNEVSAIIREEWLTNSSRSVAGARISSRLDTDVDWKYKNYNRAFIWAFYAGVVLFIFAILQISRLAILVSSYLIEHWLPTIALVALGVTTLTRIGERLSQTGVGHIVTLGIRSGAVVVVSIGILGALAYTWLAWLLLLLVFWGVRLASYTWKCVRTSRRIRNQSDVRAELISRANSAGRTTPLQQV